MEAINEYLEYIKNTRKLSANTVSSYGTDLRKYSDYLERNKIALEDVTEADILNYLVELEKENISASTAARMTSSIKSLHDYLFFMKKSGTDPSRNIKKPKVKKEKMEILTEKEVEQLLSFDDMNSELGIRDKAIFEILYGTGMKVSELVELNLSDVSDELDHIICKTPKHSRVIPIIDTTRIYLSRYIEISRPKLADNEENALFVSSLGKRFTRQGLWKIIKKYSQKANINKNINPTMLRHSFAIHMINHGANIATVNRILGNSNLASIQSYINCIDANIRKEMSTKHPRK
ncbi:integrase [Peptacetobacter hominis]|uniref:Integrase n=1 Tax=Peptacetobacter hominis TaxID=2743610 RepID=A0A544QVC6_9FIRM|nr:tyrosine-type recombinase/integrase [Peptacetobacter hominis]TQQ84645.1 integrase [Peptacetobacter hominis]